MRTMAVFVIFAVVVSCSMYVFAIDCSTVNVESIRNCNECFRCGGMWCNKGEKHPCTLNANDRWCGGENAKEERPSIAQRSVDSTVMSPSLYETTAIVGRGPRIPFTYDEPALKDPQAIVENLNTTQNFNYKIEELETECNRKRCVTYLTLTPGLDFCQDNSGKHEFLTVQLKVENVTEAATVKYHVPCACQCSDDVKRNSPICNGNGDFSCGVCNCHKGWTGDFCDETPKCEGRRGDVQCSNPYRQQKTCSGNGDCGPCDTCECYTYGEGWQYFDKNDFCSDLGLVVTIECEACLHNTTLVEGQCPDCTAIMQPCNETLLKDRDELNRTIWVEFTDNDGATYAAMKDSSNQIYIMRKSSCIGGAVQLLGNVNVTVPTVLGVVALVAVVTAAAGYMVWKARNAPVPLNASQYKELDGPENSAGLNPLYRSPTSSYNNPLWKGGAKV